jgi:hypothetical protein
MSKRVKDIVIIKGNHFQFGLIFIKKNKQTGLKKKNEPELVQTDRKLVQIDRFRFNYFRTKNGSNQFGLVFSV